jgi:hypothetical protein
VNSGKKMKNSQIRFIFILPLLSLGTGRWDFVPDIRRTRRWSAPLSQFPEGPHVIFFILSHLG